MAKTVVGSFDSFEEARSVASDLQSSGFGRDDISIVASNATGAYTDPATAPSETGADTGETASGAAKGAVAGGVLGGAAGLVAGLMGLAIPGVGPIIAAGPIAAGLAGAGVGAVAGGLIGGLTSVGVPEEEAHYYAESVRRGGALVTVRAEDAQAEEAARIMRRHGAMDIERRAASWRRSGWSRHDTAAEPYTREEIERERAQYRPSIPASDEPLVGAGTVGWQAHEPDFRGHYAANYAATGAAYEEYAPAYQYGYGLADATTYRGRPWDEIEPEARRDWEARNPGSTWERVKAAVRRGWERTSNAVEPAIPGDSDRDGR
jgi:hypothetical protein